MLFRPTFVAPVPKPTLCLVPRAASPGSRLSPASRARPGPARGHQIFAHPAAASTPVPRGVHSVQTLRAPPLQGLRGRTPQSGARGRGDAAATAASSPLRCARARRRVCAMAKRAQRCWGCGARSPGTSPPPARLRHTVKGCGPNFYVAEGLSRHLTVSIQRKINKAPTRVVKQGWFVLTQSSQTACEWLCPRTPPTRGHGCPRAMGHSRLRHVTRARPPWLPKPLKSTKYSSVDHVSHRSPEEISSNSLLNPLAL